MTPRCTGDRRRDPPRAGGGRRLRRRPAHLPDWGAGLASGIREEHGRWFADSPTGAVEVRFVAPDRPGVLDHEVTLPDGRRTLNRMRVLPHGTDAEVVFTLRRETGMTDAAFDADARAVREDLDRLKRVLES